MSIPFIFFAIILGWFTGCFINYISDVLPWTRRFTPVECPGCQAHPAPLDYLLLRSCKSCGRKRAIRAWAVQVLTVSATIALGSYAPAWLGFWPSMALLAFFGVVMVIDMEHRLILHPVSLTGAVLAAAIGLRGHGWLATLLGGLAGFGIMLALYFFGFVLAKGLGRLRGETIDEDALGFGDVSLSGVLGLLLGWPGITIGLIYAILLGGAVSLVVLISMILARKYKAFQAIPYGPFLVAGTVLVLLIR